MASARRVYALVLLGFMAQVSLMGATLVITDRSFRIAERASEFERRSTEQQLLLQDMGLLMMRLEEVLEVQPRNDEAIAILQRQLAERNAELSATAALTQELRQNAGFFRSTGERTRAERTADLLEIFQNSLTAVVDADPSVIGWDMDDLLTVAVATAPRGLLTRNFAEIADASRAQATDTIHQLRLKSAGLSIALIAISLCVALLMIRPAILRQSRAVVREAALNDTLRQQSVTDPLTGLLNRKGIDDVLEETRGKGEAFSVALIDLDRFKPINDTFGHAAGDAVLQELARRLLQTAKGAEVVSRHGGDEFMVLLPGISDNAALYDAGLRFLEIFKEAIDIGGRMVQANGSIGLAVSDTGDVRAALRNADFALYEVKGNPARRIAVFSPRPRAPACEMIERDALIEAMQTARLRPFFQPKVNLADGSVVGVEALVRWVHPDRGLLAPDAFMHAIEDLKLQADLTHHILRMSFDLMREWDRDGHAPLPVSVNVSEPILASDDVMDDLVFFLTENVDLIPRLTLEITEDVFVARATDAIIASVNRLSALGVRFSMDDFGTGYGSFRHLKEIAVQEMKIDREFISGIGRDSSSEVLIRSFIAIAHGLGATCVAEGVQSEAEAGFLRAHGCDQAQGFLYAPALEAEALYRWIDSYSRRQGRMPPRIA